MRSSESTLPPDSTAMAGPVPGILPARRAASVTAPAGSTTALARSSSNSSARLISSSVTVTTSSTYACTWASVSGDGHLTAMPSAIVCISSSRSARPAASDAFIDAAPSASTPTTRTPPRGGGRGGGVPGVRQGGGEPGDEATAPHRRHHHLGVGDLLGQLEADGALAGDDQRVVERG